MVTGTNSRFVLTAEEHFNRLQWAPGVTITGEDVRAFGEAVEAVSSEGVRPLLVHLNSVRRITPAARQLIVRDTCSTRTAILGEDPVSMVITAFAYTSRTPTRFFTDEREAIEWLLEASPANDPHGA